MKRKAKRPRRRRPSVPRIVPFPEELDDRGEIVTMLRDMISHGETGPVLTGGDLDADWSRAHLVGEEAVGGSVTTPDKDVVDEIGRALGVEQAPDAEVRTSEEILRDRSRFRWHLEREAADEEEKRGRPPRRRRRSV